MGRLWLTADWHLGETRMELLGRPYHSADEMYWDLLQKHNALVKPDDQVIIIGDVVSNATTDPDGWLEKVGNFAGQKHLIRGNHDRRFTDEQFKKYFHLIFPEGGGMETMVGGILCWLTHYPTCSTPKHFNLVGHIHGRWHIQKNMLNVGVDVSHYAPIPEENVKFHYDSIHTYYDADVWVADHPANVVHNNRGLKTSYFKPEQSNG